MSTPISKAEDSTLAEAIALRASQRRSDFERNVPEAESLKEEGNQYFKDGDYENAAESYLAALRLVRKETYYSNLAAAKIKLEEYEQAAAFAELALVSNPRNVKARYRRVQSRKSLGLYKSALCDAEAILCIDHNCEAAKVEVEELKRLLRRRRPRRDDLDDEDDWPGIDDDPLDVADPEYYTDSEDSRHFGNSVPCKYYNHDGCMRGSYCAFSHAPDDLSVRDRLGKNVCTFFILGNCKFGDGKCNYSHFKGALPQTGWWTEPNARAEMADFMKTLGKSGILKARLAPHSCPRLSGRVHSSLGRGVNNGAEKGGGKKTTRQTKPSSANKRCWHEDDERLQNYGFTQDDVEELLCQGVNPWDEDAWDVMAVLNGDF